MRQDPELEELAASARAGDHDAAAELWERFAPLVRRLARQYAWLQEGDLNDDLLGEAFIRFVELAHGYDPSHGVGIAGYLRGALSVALRAAAQRLARPASHEASLEGLRVEIGAGDPTAEEAVRYEWLRAGLDQLTPRQRYVVIRRVVYGAEIEEIAGALHSTPGAVRVLLSRALHRLREILGGDSSSV